MTTRESITSNQRLSMLHIICFNTFQAFHDGQEITRFRSAKERALLIYLTVEQDRTHQRATLAGLLWPDEPEAKARHNLSQTLVNLRKAIGDRDVDPPYLLISPQTIAFNPASAPQVDVTTFLHYLRDGTPAARQKAIDLYTGPFLDDFSVADSDLLENWILTERERLQQLALDTFRTLCMHYEEAGELQQAQQVVRRLLALAPWQEKAHCQLMRLLALSGERTMALAQYDTLFAILMDELGVPPSEETNQLYDQILAGEIGAVVGAAATVTGAHSIPPPFQALTTPPHFVGREAEIIKLRAGLTVTDAPVYALVGMGGAGKTTLAAQMAHLLRADFANGVLWANAATSAPLDILAAWARAYGYDFGGLGDLASRAAAVRGVLADKAVLIVLDNVLEASAIQVLLPGGAHNPVLLTTRDLDVAHALNAQVLLLGELSPESSRHLLAQILGEERVAAEVEAAAQIGLLLHYLPLAVEIVAQRLKSRPRQQLAQMAARLGDEAQRLGLEISDRAVRASFAVSWDGLDEGLQCIFALQSVFAGRPFAAEAIAYLADSDLFDVEDQLYALVALSLLREEGERFFRQHPLLADFAREQLAQADGANVDAVYGRMVEYYLIFAEENRERYDRLELEWGNLMSAIETAHRQESWTQALVFTELLSQAWLTRARYGDARRAYALAQEATLKQEDEEARAKNLLRWGEVCIEQNDYDEASQHLDNSLTLYYRLEEGAGIANAQFASARVAIERGQYDEATELLNSCLSIRRTLGDAESVAAILHRQAWVSYAHDDLDTTDKLLQDALQTYEVTQNKRRLMPALRFLAQVAAKREAYILANEYCERAYQLAQELEDEGELATLYYTWTVVLRRQGKFDEARSHAEQALPLLQRFGLRRFEGMVCYQLGAILKELQEHVQAQSYVLESIEIFESIQDALGNLFSLILLGDLYQVLEMPDKSRHVWLKAQVLAERLKDHNVFQELQEKLEAFA